MNYPETPLHHFDDPTFTPDAPVEDFPFDDPVKEEQFQKAWHVLKTTEDPRAKPSWWLFLIVVALLVFVVLPGGNLGPAYLGLLAGVILLHELGHFIAMKFFGYTDGRLFLLPFFALLARGHRHAAPAWQQAWTTLMGPLPGLLLAAALYLAWRDDSPVWGLRLVLLLVGLNVLNLLPFIMCDAGKLMSLVVYSRNAYVETLMQLVSAGAFAALAYWQENFLLAGLALVMALSAPMVYRTGQMISRLRREGIRMPDTVAALQPIHGRMLFAATYDVLGAGRAQPVMLANLMRQLHDRVLVPAPGLLATTGFLLLYLAGWALAVGTLFLFATDLHALQTRLQQVHFKRPFLAEMQAGVIKGQLRNLKGPARDQKLAELQRVQQQIDAWKQSEKEVLDKLDRFRQVLTIPGQPAPGDLFPNDDPKPRDDEDQ